MGSEVSDSNRENLTDAQKDFLNEVFQEREHTSKKADPSIISKAMRRAKLSNGSNIFQKIILKNVRQTERETSKSLLIEELIKTFALQHPIMFDKYNICETKCHA
ncbi:hypothetical protein pdam_00012347 [Pocillopora damicornis]|uniref:Uncharacterized protein n=1 Tax=Pocillopora damicornis TaxID=46731 RepID=A0A3M6U212_POCDA|nr:hypothetical protein pdam_00012347 [Pocillopora damicornis]